MSWKSSLLALVKKHGAAAKFATTTVLSAVLPGSPAVVDMVKRAFDTAQQSAQDDWEQRLAEATQASAAELERLGEVLTVLDGDLGMLVAQVAALEGLPDVARQILDAALASDRGVQAALGRLADLAGSFERVEQQNRRLLEGQDEMLPLLRRCAGVADFVEELRTAGLDAAGFRAHLGQMRQALAELGRGRLEEAGEALREVTAARPGSAAAQVALAGVEAAQHRLPQAQQALTRAIRLRPADAGLRELEAHATRALTAQTPGGPPAPVARRLRPGDVVDGWALAERLGSGGWGAVFRATRGERERALKVLHPELAVDEAFVERFKAEILTLAGLRGRSRHLVAIEGFGYDRATASWYLVMEYVAGQTLEQRLARHGPLTAAEGRGLFAAVADGLAVAHERGVAHRDVKPGNVMLRLDGSPVLVDFGLAVGTDGGLTRAGQTAGYTPLFAAPEQLRGKAADARADVYALGGSLYYALRYDRPGQREPDEYDPAQAPAELRAVLTRALAVRAGDRYPDAAAFRDALRDAHAAPAAVQAVLPESRPLTPTALEKLGAAFGRDDNAPGRPVVMVNLWQDAVVTAEAMATLKGLPQLRKLQVGGSRLTDELLAHLGGLTQVEELILRGHHFTDAGLVHLKGLTRLRVLDLKEPAQGRIGDAGLAHLSGLAQLQSLDLWGLTRVTDAGLAHLRGLTELRSLVLFDTVVTDAGLAHLKGLTRLRSLNVRCTRVTAAGVAWLKGVLPELEVIR